jgi:hypothetical protein
MDWEKLIADLAPWIIAGGTIVLNYLEHRHKNAVDMASDMMAQYKRVVSERDVAQARVTELEAELEKKESVIDEIINRKR